MTHIDLFSGVGSCSLASHWAGFETIQFVELNPFCQSKLTKNFPGIPIHDDIKTFSGWPFRGRTTVLSGGFPCQDVSTAGRGAGLDGERSGLVFEMLRVIDECRPLFCLFENSPALRTRGIDRITDELERIDYSARPFVVGAGNAGAPHRRQRCFLVAYDHSLRQLQQEWVESFERRRADNCAESGLDSNFNSGSRCLQPFPSESVWSAGTVGSVPCSLIPWREIEPPVCGVVSRIANRVDRIKALGNTNPPQVYYPFFKLIADFINDGRQQNSF